MFSSQQNFIVAALAFAGASASANSPSTPTNDSMATCIANMDGVPPAYLPPGFHSSGITRKYYIAAEEEEWDYAPTGKLNITIKSYFKRLIVYQGGITGLAYP